MTDFMNFPTSREKVLTDGNTTIGIIPEICLISHFQVGSWQVLYRPMATGNVKRWGLPLMIPNFSRLQDGVFKDKNTTLPIHGFGRNLPWTVTEQNTASLSMQLQSSDATRPHYPYEFTFTTTVTVEPATLTYTLQMENRGDEVMPIAPGFHPYFSIAQQDKPHIKVEGLPGFDVHAFDWQTSIPDNPYPFSSHTVTVHIPHRGTLTIAELPVDNSYRLKNMQVWSEPPTKPDSAFVCFEPTVSSEDALNRPADRLEIAPRSMQQIVLQLRAEPS